jgi:hypothetical protein
VLEQVGQVDHLVVEATVAILYLQILPLLVVVLVAQIQIQEPQVVDLLVGEDGKGHQQILQYLVKAIKAGQEMPLIVTTVAAAAEVAEQGQRAEM